METAIRDHLHRLFDRVGAVGEVQSSTRIEAETPRGRLQVETTSSGRAPSSPRRLRVELGKSEDELEAFGACERDQVSWQAAACPGRRVAILEGDELDGESIGTFLDWTGEFLRAPRGQALAMLFELGHDDSADGGLKERVHRAARRWPWLGPLLYAEAISLSVIGLLLSGSTMALYLLIPSLPLGTIGWIVLMRRLQPFLELKGRGALLKDGRAELGRALRGFEAVRRLGGREGVRQALLGRVVASSSGAGIELEADTFALRSASTLLPLSWTAIRLRRQNDEVGYYWITNRSRRDRQLSSLLEAITTARLPSPRGPYR